MQEILTPHGARQMRRAIRHEYAAARSAIAKARALRATGKPLDREDAESELTMASLYREGARRLLRRLKAARVQKWAAISPNAAARERRRRGLA